MRYNKSLAIIISLVVCASYEATTSANTTVAPSYCSDDSQFYCHKSDECKPIYVRCDKKIDCDDGEDEEGCVECTQENAADMNKFYCVHSKECLPLSFKCDKFPDCEDPVTLEAADEDGCEEVTCTEEQFECAEQGAKKCLGKGWVCDGQPDCDDALDEQNCEHSCKEDEFKCKAANSSNTFECIKNRWVCDGEPDCPLGDDEVNCNLTCEANRFLCSNESKCMPNAWKCDGDVDCASGEDEQNCPKPSEAPQAEVSRCTRLEFKCATGFPPCIIGAWKCDGESDCEDGSDEDPKMCPVQEKACSKSEFKCKADDSCIPKFLTCSGKAECPDGEDEKLESCASNRSETCDLTKGQFACGDTVDRCITLDKMCDGVDDCQSRRDEDDSICGRSAITNFCSDGTHRCGSDPLVSCREITTNFTSNYNRTIGFVCECPAGYIKVNNKCIDADECTDTEDPVCDHICINTIGSYRCECNTGYMIELDMRSCKVEGGIHPKLLFTNRHEIRSVHIHGRRDYMPLLDSKGAVALDFDYKTSEVFYTDMEELKLFKFKLPNDDSEDEPKGIDLNIPVQTPAGMAYDWIYKHLYWTDTSANSINMACVDDDKPVRNSKLLYKNKDPLCQNKTTSAKTNDVCIDEPRALVVHPRKGWVFWSDWGKNPHIVLAAMDGSHKEMIAYNTDSAHEYLLWPNGLTVDLSSENERLYWIDARLSSLFTCTINRCVTDIRVLVFDQKNIRHPFSITVFENKLYWSDWSHKHIVSANKYTGQNITKVLTDVEQPMDLKVYHPMTQQSSANYCTVSPGAPEKCQHICVPKPWSRNSTNNNFRAVHYTEKRYTCLCSDGYKLNNDGKTCSEVVVKTTKKPLTSSEAVRGVSQSQPGMTTGTIAVIASVCMLVICIIIVLIIVFTVRRIRQGKSKSMNFDNPIYRKTTEDKLELPRHEYQPAQTCGEPSAMVPLTSSEGGSSTSTDDYGV